MHNTVLPKVIATSKTFILKIKGAVPISPQSSI